MEPQPKPYSATEALAGNPIIIYPPVPLVAVNAQIGTLLETVDAGIWGTKTSIGAQTLTFLKQVIISPPNCQLNQVAWGTRKKKYTNETSSNEKQCATKLAEHCVLRTRRHENRTKRSKRLAPTCLPPDKEW